MDETVGLVLAALERQDWDTLKPLLHPYLHWTDRSGKTIRGRTQVLARLREAAPTGQPAHHELRDAQIYRWKEA
jgi:hypothetical protein